MANDRRHTRKARGDLKPVGYLVKQQIIRLTSQIVSECVDARHLEPEEFSPYADRILSLALRLDNVVHAGVRVPKLIRDEIAAARRDDV